MTRADVEATRARVRADGKAHVEGMQIPGLKATAFPIFDFQGRAGLTAAALMPDFHRPAGHDDHEDQLRVLCRTISERAGWRLT